MAGKKNSPRILLLYIGDVSGHGQGARAIKKAFQQEYPEVIVREENLFRHGNPFVRCSLDSLYNVLIRLTPWFWNIIWDSKEVYWLTYLLRGLLYRMNYHRLYREVIKPFNPQVVVCTHCLSCAICSTIKYEKNLNYFLIAVPTDFYLNPYWFYKNVDMYFLPQNNSSFEYLKRRIPSEKLLVTGIPISPEFVKSKDRFYLKDKWQLREDLFTILIMGGGQGLGAIKEVVLSLEKVSLPIQIMVVTGTNRSLKRDLRKISSRLKFPFKILGYVREIDELMEISDLLITKPGGLTTAEALSKGLPMVVVDSIAGQERRNKELLLKKSLAFNLDDPEQVVSLVKNCINGGFNRKLWEERAKQLARPNASLEIACKIMKMLKYQGKVNAMDRNRS